VFGDEKLLKDQLHCLLKNAHYHPDNVGHIGRKKALETPDMQHNDDGAGRGEAGADEEEADIDPKLTFRNADGEDISLSNLYGNENEILRLFDLGKNFSAKDLSHGRLVNRYDTEQLQSNRLELVKAMLKPVEDLHSQYASSGAYCTCSPGDLDDKGELVEDRLCDILASPAIDTWDPKQYDGSVEELYGELQTFEDLWKQTCQCVDISAIVQNARNVYAQYDTFADLSDFAKAHLKLQRQKTRIETDWSL
jgi:hypothetical protein